MITGNRGEWSEIYVLFKLLGDGHIYGGDGNLNRLPELLYPIIKIIRQESPNEFHYRISEDSVEVFDNNRNVVLTSLPKADFEYKAIRLLRKIKTSSATFSATDIEAFMSAIYCSSLKARSTDKADIKLVVHDERTGLEPLLGFSIKSRLGAASTLVNAGRTTNFRFRLTRLTLSASEVVSTNRLPVKQLVSFIYSRGGRFVFDSVANTIFESNLTLVDSKLPEIIGNILLEYYSSTTSKLSDLIASVSARNPLNYNLEHGHNFYVYKVKKYLAEAALGMQPSRVWSGIYDASGGYIIVKEDGDVLCYHVYHRNTLEDYLFANTKLDTASTSRHGFGELYIEGGNVYLNLNLQIRFTA